jgi:uncharacterized protein YecT (DUF1311 family)
VQDAVEKKAGISGQKIIIGAVLLILLAGFFVWRHMAAASADISGVWHGQTSGLSYVIDRHEDSYRLSVGGHRLLIKDIQKDRMTGQLVLTVRTDSGLLALWSFKAGKDAAGAPVLQLDQDSVASDELHLQRELTAVDRSRLVQSKIAKKPLWAPAFDCGKADTDVERMICTDQSLGAMDVQMAKAVHAAVNDAAISDAQKTWLHDVRDACTDLNCLHTAYQQRLLELGVSNGAAPEVPPPADAGTDSTGEPAPDAAS